MTCTSREGAKNKIVEKRNSPEKYEFIACQKILRFFLGILIQKTIFWQAFLGSTQGKIDLFNEKAALRGCVMSKREQTVLENGLDTEKCLDLSQIRREISKYETSRRFEGLYLKI